MCRIKLTSKGSLLAKGSPQKKKENKWREGFHGAFDFGGRVPGENLAMLQLLLSMIMKRNETKSKALPRV